MSVFDYLLSKSMADYWHLKYMYRNLGDHWASSVPAFLALGCVPFPILFYRYGSRIRARCRYAAEAAHYSAEMGQEV